jgi:hypothetical protein
MVFMPLRAAASAAQTPAIPPPTTQKSVERIFVLNDLIAFMRFPCSKIFMSLIIIDKTKIDNMVKFNYFIIKFNNIIILD